jgi:hypothetical protein
MLENDGRLRRGGDPRSGVFFMVFLVNVATEKEDRCYSLDWTGYLICLSKTRRKRRDPQARHRVQEPEKE